ncbi:hypothetical protein [Streptomyces sp. NPDC048663]|uniref:DUF6891 domain-containing protein n=1 Tax=Streptomyces sp. NPDC048663 TaxID=3155638 RepID=UPI00342B5D82
METEEKLAVNARTENGRRYLWSAPDGLREAVRGLGPAGNRFLVVQRVPDLPREFAQVWHEEDGDYRLEHRRGTDEFAGTNPDAPDRVARLPAGWARRDDGWDAGIAWEPVPLPPTAPAPALPADVAARAEDLVRALLREGYLGIDRLVRETVELMADEGPDGTAPLSAAPARELVERLWVARVAEQRAWTGPTDPERLSRAFTALEREGVAAREDFTCCRSCGTAEIGAEAEDAGGARGFVFFHRRSTRCAAEGHGPSLHYGGFDGTAETTTAVGREVTAALTAAGLSAVWDGDPAKAIELTSLTWHKRLVG